MKMYHHSSLKKNSLSFLALVAILSSMCTGSAMADDICPDVYFPCGDGGGSVGCPVCGWVVKVVNYTNCMKVVSSAFNKPAAACVVKDITIFPCDPPSSYRVYDYPCLCMQEKEK